MLTQTAGEVISVVEIRPGCQEIVARCGAAQRAAVNYPALTGLLEIGDHILLNTTAQTLRLGTGGCDFVVAKVEEDCWPGEEGAGHIIKARYLPCQQSVLTLEEQPDYADLWEKTLDGFPVLVGQLHSQIAPAAAALALGGRTKIAYIMTDQAALPIAFSHLAHQLSEENLLSATLTCGQAFGGDYETVTLHSALLAARHLLEMDAAIVCQGPGNAGTGTKYGFSGIEQAQNLDIVSALGGTPIAIVRISSADRRERHQGVSHHTKTTLALTHSRCIVPLPAGADAAGLPEEKHEIRFVENTQAALDLLQQRNIRVTTMGRSMKEDPIFFAAAAAAGMAAG